MEQLLERWQDLSVARRNELRNLIVEGLTKRLEIDAPNERDRLRFLEDLLAAEYRRQVRRLG